MYKYIYKYRRVHISICTIGLYNSWREIFISQIFHVQTARIEVKEKGIIYNTSNKRQEDIYEYFMEYAYARMSSTNFNIFTLGLI